MIVGVVKETFPGERRVAMTPDLLPQFKRLGLELMIEGQAGLEAGFPDEGYVQKGATVASSRDEIFDKADLLLQVRGHGSNPDAGRADLERMRSGQIIIGMLDPLSEPAAVKELAERKVVAFAMEMMPRITRAQSMDVLSSMATIAGYKAVLIAADALPKMFPLMMTAAGTISAAKVFVVGAGVAGLQAIASAKRMGAVVSGYDVRPAVKEQVESLGAKFVEMKLEAGQAEDKGGYAKELGEEFYRKQRELMTRVVAENDVVITTAAIPGKKAPVLITEAMVQGMLPGAVIVDLAAERGGNCELTKPGETMAVHGVTIIGPLNLPSTIPYHASQMYARNLMTFLKEIIKDGALALDLEKNEVHAETLMAREGEVVHPRIRELLGIGTSAIPQPSESSEGNQSA